jgi:hypothetical protein
VNPPLLELDRLFGLPAHPLLVHGAVVLVPLAAGAFIVAGVKQSWRHAYYFPITVIALAGGFLAFLAKQSGEPLTDSVRQAGQRVGEHPEQGDTAFFFAMLFALACAGAFALLQFGPRLRKALPIDQIPTLPVSYDTLVYLGTASLAVVAIVTMVVAGHSGAKLVWETNVR